MAAAAAAAAACPINSIDTTDDVITRLVGDNHDIGDVETNSNECAYVTDVRRSSLYVYVQ